MSKKENAVNWAVSIANDNSHGYSRTNRWGPDYDCSSLVITAWENAGVPVKTKGATYTENMYNVFLMCGFQDVTASVNRSTGAGLERGDVLLNIINHTAMYIGGGQIVQASGTRGYPQAGDQTGTEIWVCPYSNYSNGGWDRILRYKEYGLGEPVFIKQLETLDIGFNFSLPTEEGRFKYLLYDLNKNEWSTLVEWTASNWISLALDKGSYWVQCQLYDLQSNLIDTKTIGTDAGSATEITGTYAGWQGEDILIGCSTNNPGAKIVMKLYNVNTGQWFTQFEGQWATFRPEAGTNYIVQFEVRTQNGRLLDFKAVGV